MTPPKQPTPRRSASGRRVASTTQATPSRRSLLLAVLVPVVTLVAIAATDGSAVSPRPPVPPQEAALSSLQVVCPPALSGGDVSISSARATGSVALRLGDVRSESTITQDATTVVPDQDASVVVDGRDALAPGLIAARIDDRAAAALSCAPPQSDYWFTGVGAASIHSSDLELVNPDSGPAVADVEIYGANGIVPVDAVRGVTVPGGTATTIDLAATAPNRNELAVHVTVARGRLGASMVDRISDTDRYADWLAPQAEPATSNVLLGLTKGAGERQLVVSNPSEDQARVQVKVIGSDSTFAPVGLDEISVPPQSVVVTDVSAVVRKAIGKQESGLLVTSSLPVTVGLRSVTGSTTKDLSHAVGAAPVQEAALLVPKGDATLLLAAPDVSGAVSVTSYDAQGKKLATKRVVAKRLTSASLALPKKTSMVVVKAEGKPLPAAVRVVTDRGVVVLPLQELVLSTLVPAVSPGSASVQQAGEPVTGQSLP